MTGVQNSLTGLYQTIEARLALYKPLASLQGRLDLVLAQAAPVDPLASHLAAGPLVSAPTLAIAASKPDVHELIWSSTLVVCRLSYLSMISLQNGNNSVSHSLHLCIPNCQAVLGVHNSVHED